MLKEGEWPYPPAICQWDLTKNCNLACRHCRATLLKESHDLEYEQITPILDQLITFAPNITIALVGGEPLTRRDLRKILSFAREKSDKLDLEILTNGTLITKENVSWLTELANGFNISLEASNPKDNDAIRGEKAFKKAVEGITLLRAKGAPVAVRMTFFHQPEEEVENLMRFLPEIGVNHFNFRYLVPVGRAIGQKISPEQYQRLAKKVWQLGQELKIEVGFSDPFPEIFVNPAFRQEIEKDKELMDGQAVTGCSVGFQLLYLDPSGEVKACPYFPLKIDDAKKVSLEKIWFSNKTLAALRRARSCLEGKCGACQYKFACGGCLGAAASTGNFLSGDPRCWHNPDLGSLH